MTTPRRLTFFLLNFLIVVGACKKDNIDEQSPNIVISSPSASSSFNYGDTLRVVAHVKDDNVLNSIKVEIVNSNMIGVLPAQSFFNCGNFKEILVDFIINNSFLESGLHYLNIVAFDGTNYKTKQVPITIYGLPRKLLGVIFISKSDETFTHVNEIDTLGNSNLKITLSDDYFCSEIASKYQKLYVAGSRYGKFNSINLSDFTVDWNINNESNNTQPWFYQLYYNNGEIYTSTQNGLISAYSTSGIRTGLYTLGSGWHANQLFLNEGHLFACVKSNSNSNSQLAQFYSSSHVLITQHNLDFDAIKMFAHTSEYIYFVGNTQTSGKIYNYNFLLQQFDELKSIGNEQIIDAVELLQNHFLLLTNTGVYYYNNDQNLNQLTQVITTQGGIQLLYNETSGTAVVVKPHEIAVYSYPDGLLKSSFSCSEEIVKAHLHFNR